MEIRPIILMTFERYDWILAISTTSINVPLKWIWTLNKK